MSLRTTVGRTLRQAGERMERTSPDRAPLWPSVDDLKRRNRYDRGKRLYAGEHKTLFEPKRDETKHGPYIVCNALRAASRVFGDRMTLEAPEATVGDREDLEDVFQRITQDSEWGRMLLRAIRGWSYRGDLVLKGLVRPDPITEEQEVIIREVLPGNYFPVFDPEDSTRVESVSICWELDMPQGEWQRQGTPERYQREELHTPGLIQNRLYVLRKTEETTSRYTREQIALTDVERYADVPEEIQTEIDEIPIVHIPNNEMTEEMPWGTSDYAGAEDQQRALNERATDHRHMLRKWSDPLIGVSFAYLNEKRDFNAYGQKALPILPGEEKPAHISVPLENFPHSDTEAKNILRRLLWTIGISPESIGIQEGAYPESGRAIRLRQADTLSTVARKWVVLEPGLKHILSIALKLANAHTGAPEPVPPEEIELEHGDGLLRDEREELESLQLEKALGFSDEYLIRRRHPGWNDDAVEEELERRKAQRPTLPEVEGRPGAAGSNPRSNAPPNIRQRMEELAEEQDREAQQR